MSTVYHTNSQYILIQNLLYREKKDTISENYVL